MYSRCQSVGSGRLPAGLDRVSGRFSSERSIVTAVQRCTAGSVPVHNCRYWTAACRITHGLTNNVRIDQFTRIDQHCTADVQLSVVIRCTKGWLSVGNGVPRVYSGSTRSVRRRTAGTGAVYGSVRSVTAGMGQCTADVCTAVYGSVHLRDHHTVPYIQSDPRPVPYGT